MPSKEALPPLSSLPPHLREELKHVQRDRAGRKVKSEAEHFYVCPICAQAVDSRSLYQVLHHEDEKHEPLSEALLSETSPVEMDLGRAVKAAA